MKSKQNYTASGILCGEISIDFKVTGCSDPYHTHPHDPDNGSFEDRDVESVVINAGGEEWKLPEDLAYEISEHFRKQINNVEISILERGI